MIEIMTGDKNDYPNTTFCSGEEPEHRLGLPNYWINTANLNLVIQDRLYGYKGLGPAVDYTLTYNSMGSHHGLFGINWSFSQESFIEATAEEVRLIRGSGQILRYRHSSGKGESTAPLELNSLSGSMDRLLDYGAYWCYIPRLSRIIFRYDKSARNPREFLSSISDYDGNIVKWEYNPNGGLSRIVDAAGRATIFGYARGDGFCTTLRIPDGREAKFSYDAQHRLVQVSDLHGIVTEYTYGPDNALTRMVVGEDSKTTVFSYWNDRGGKSIAAVQDAAGNTTRYEMVSASEVRVIDPEGNTTSYRSARGRTERIVDPLGNTVEYTYKSGFRVGIRNKNGVQIRKEYDGRGNVTRIEDPEGHNTFFEYDAYDNPIRRRDALGGVLTYSYNDQQHLVRMVTPLGRTFLWNYDQKGQLIAMTDPSGNITTMEYDRFGNLAAMRDPGGYQYQLRYDATGLRIQEVLHPTGSLYRYEYDGNDRIKAVHHPDGTVTRYRHGCCAPLSVTDEQGNTVSFTRNPLLSVLERTDALGNRTRYRYDHNNTLTGMTDPLGNTTSFFCDAAGRVVRAVDPAGQTAHFVYDAEGNLISLSDPGGSRTLFQYDTSNRRVQITDNLKHTKRFERDPLGRLVRVANARGMVMEYRYDADGHLVEKLHEGHRVAAYGYTPAGSPALVEDSCGSTRFEYDNRRLVTRIWYPGGASIELFYNEEGNVREMRYPGNLIVSYVYDPCGRVSRISWGSHFYARSYDATGSVIRETRSNGVESVYEYDATRVFTRISHAGRTGTIADLLYRWDAAGNIVEESGILPLPDHPPATAAGPAQAASYNSENQMVSWGMQRFLYDDDGNRTSAGGDGRTLSAEYDTENRAARITTARQSLQLSYNGIGDLVGTMSGGQKIRDLYTPEGHLVVRTEGTGTILNSFIYCEGRLIAMVEPGGNTRFYHFDKTGNTLALTEETGNTVAEYSYDVFGAVTGREGDSGKNPFTYAGEFGVMDMGDDLFFMRHRLYDATTGTFLQKDPIGYLGGTNLYSYVGGNPVTRVDPEGTQAPQIAFCCLLVTVAIGYYVSYCAAKKFGEKNAVVQTLKVSQQGNADANTKNAKNVNKEEFFGNPDHGMNQVITTAGDQALTINPVTNPTWSMIKGVNSAAEGKPVDAALNTLSAFPDGIQVITGPGKTLSEVHKVVEIPVGSLFTAGGQVKTMCTDPPPGR